MGVQRTVQVLKGAGSASVGGCIERHNRKMGCNEDHACRAVSVTEEPRWVELTPMF